MKSTSDQPPSGERPPIDPIAWIKARLGMHTVYEEGGKWHARFQIEELGEFPTQTAALKAYRAAAEKRFGTAAVLPTDEEIDKAGVQEAPGRPIPPTRPAPGTAPPRPARK